MVAAFKERLQQLNPVYVTFDSLQTLQLNLGDRCNLACRHCHVNASPTGEKVMGQEIMDAVIALLSRLPGVTLDITGGCPEMNPRFRYLVEHTSGLSPRRMVRSNLVIITEPGMEWLPEFYRSQGLVIVASLPCYLEENVDRQRGDGVYARSIEALQRLNAIGYGTELELNLVYNPGGDLVPGAQLKLQEAYQKELAESYGIRFNNLYTITNAPLGRFRDYLQAKGAYDRYLNLLATSFNPAAAGNIMCRNMVSVDWQGFLYNCDFNQAAGLPITDSSGRLLKVAELHEAALQGSELLLAQHCYCCTAGEGSSCTGSLVF